MKKTKNYDYWLDCDYVSGACYCHENALKHFHINDILVNQKSYGFAISHLILGAEELIKALILIKLNTERYFIEDEQKEELFRNHSFKHIKILEFLRSMTNGEMDEYYENWFDLMNSANSTNKFRQTGFFLSKTLKLGSIEDSEIIEIDKLIKNANNLKNSGLYVDYKNDWELPGNLDENTYLNYAPIIKKLRNFIEPLFTMPLGNNPLTEFIYGH